MPGPFPGIDAGGALDTVAHVIQVALTPVFLLSGIGTLLNMLTTRQGRVSDHLARASELLKAGRDADEAPALRRHLVRLRRRLLALDAAIVLGAVGGAATCGAALALFVGGLGGASAASWLLGLFGAALACTVAALLAFVMDTLLAWHALRRDGPAPRPKLASAG